MRPPNATRARLLGSRCGYFVGSAADRTQGIDLAVAIEAVIASASLTGLWRAVRDRREERVHRGVGAGQ